MTYQEFSTSAKIPGIHRPGLFKGSVNIEVDQAHYLFSTSGSSGKKHYLHSLKSIENAVESFLKSHPLESSDRWWVSLSTRHVAGFSILARSFFGGLKKPFEKSFVLDVDLMKSEDITLLSLVPTQIFDIVSKKIEAPPHLKYVFVGGARLSDELFLKANNLGWPLVSCFGATETFAQFSSSKDNIDFTAYDGWEIKSNNQKELEVKGPSLFSYQIFESGQVTKRKSDWINLNDEVNVRLNTFSFIQKSDSRYKLKGAFVDFNEQKSIFENFLLTHRLDQSKSLLLVLEEERSGAGLYIVTSDLVCAEKAMEALPELRGCFLYKDIKFLLSDIGKPVKTKIESALARPLLLS